MTDRVYLQPLPACAQAQAAGLTGSFELIVRGAESDRTQVISGGELPRVFAALPDELAARAAEQSRALSALHSAVSGQCGRLSLMPAAVMGILNLTPDSFSDGGLHVGEGALAHAANMRVEGAAIIDIGGESTRPGAAMVSHIEELRRVIPAIERIAADGGIVSIDTRDSRVMAAALAAGASIVNDVSALRHDPHSLDIVASAGAPVILMHAPGQGADLHAGGGYRDVALDVFDFLEARRDAAIAGGIDRARIILDPGIGFGKSVADNLTLLRRLPLFAALGCPLLVGASRKRMIAAINQGASPYRRSPERRLGGSLALALAALEGGAQILRVHDVAETVQAAAVWRALREA